MFIRNLFVAVLFLFSVQSYALDGIGIVDMQKLVQSMPEIEQTRVDIEKKFSGDIDSLRKIDEEAQGIASQLQKDAALLTDAKKEELSKRFEALRIQFTEKQRELNAASQAEQQKAQDVIFEKIRKAIESVSKKKSLSVVLDKNATLFSTNKYDITQDVLKVVNK